jgi:hypothetical protein
MVTVMLIVAPSGCVALTTALAMRDWMAANAAATGAASCVSSVSKLNVPVSRTGSVGLKSQNADWVVLGPVLLLACESIALFGA